MIWLPALMAAAAAAASPPAAPSPPPGSSPPVGGTAEGVLAHYFSINDYPRKALERREEGTVGFRVLVGRDGKVSRCTVIESSGSKALDEATCRIAGERLRYNPARDAEGKPVEDSHDYSVRWTIPSLAR